MRQLRFDVRLVNDAPDTHIHSLKNLWNVNVDVDHRHIEAVIVVVLQQLIAEQAARNHESIIESVDARDTESPVDVIGLELVRHALDIKDELVLLEAVRAPIINQRETGIWAA